MTWTQLHNRAEILRAVIEAANTRRDGLLPMDVPGVASTFGDELTLLGALMLKWHTRLDGHLERQLHEQPMDLDAAVIAAWCSACDELPGVRDVLDHYRAEPTDDAMAAAVARATAKEHSRLATVAGLSSVYDERGIQLGASLEDRARDLRDAMPMLPVTARPTLLERLREFLVA